MLLSLPSSGARRALIAGCAAAAVAGASFTVAHAVDTTFEDQVGLPHEVVEDAEAWQKWVTNASAVNAKFKGGVEVRTALKTGASYEPDQLEHGEVAYAALVALQEGDFVEELRRRAQDPSRNEELARKILNNPTAIYEVPGAEQAAGLVSAKLSDEGHHLYQTGAEVKQSAYDIQHAAWSRQRDRDGKQRLAQVKELSASRFVSKPEDAEQLKKVLVAMGHTEEPAAFSSRNASPVVTRGLVLASLAVLGRMGDRDTVQAVMNDPYTKQCLTWAKMNLYQCLAVAGPRYEDVFCLAEHGLKETATCVEKSTKVAWTDRDWTPGRYAAVSHPYVVVAAVEPVAPPKGRHGRAAVHHAAAKHAAHGHRRHHT
jgi:hypothetical protein